MRTAIGILALLLLVAAVPVMFRILRWDSRSSRDARARDSDRRKYRERLSDGDDTQERAQF